MPLVSQQPPIIWCGLGEAVKRCPQCALEYDPDLARDRRFADSPLEQRELELSVPSRSSCTSSEARTRSKRGNLKSLPLRHPAVRIPAQQEASEAETIVD